MSRIGLIAAMPGELKPLTRGWQHTRSNGVDLWRQPHDGGEWIAACAGAGVAAATRAFAEVEAYGPLDAVISIGWAGALRPELLPGQAYCAVGVLDARTGERFETFGCLESTEALKGHGFIRAAETQKNDAALAAEGMCVIENTSPQGLKPKTSWAHRVARLKSCPFKTLESLEQRESLAQRSFSAASKAVPFQGNLWVVTTPRVADAAEKQRLAAAYGAALVEMEAAALARLAQMREIPFCCVKGISDGYSDKLPDFNRFILPNGRLRLASFVLFAALRPQHWIPLMRMGENSQRASRRIAERVLGILNKEGSIKKPND
jgi:nucleoside phosphorylase